MKHEVVALDSPSRRCRFRAPTQMSAERFGGLDVSLVLHAVSVICQVVTPPVQDSSQVKTALSAFMMRGYNAGDCCFRLAQVCIPERCHSRELPVCTIEATCQAAGARFRVRPPVAPTARRQSKEAHRPLRRTPASAHPSNRFPRHATCVLVRT